MLDRVAISASPCAGIRRKANSTSPTIQALPRVDVILTYQGAPGDLIKAAVDNGAKGVVIAGAGTGATSGTQGEGISYATEKGVFVVTTTRSGAGGVGGGGRGGATRRIGGDDFSRSRPASS